MGLGRTWRPTSRTAPTRAGRLAWSPEQISRRLVLDFHDDDSMRIGHKAMHQALYIHSRGAAKRELVACLQTGRALRKPRERVRNRG